MVSEYGRANDEKNHVFHNMLSITSVCFMHQSHTVKNHLASPLSQPPPLSLSLPLPVPPSLLPSLPLSLPFTDSPAANPILQDKTNKKRAENVPALIVSFKCPIESDQLPTPYADQSQNGGAKEQGCTWNWDGRGSECCSDGHAGRA